MKEDHESSNHIVFSCLLQFIILIHLDTSLTNSILEKLLRTPPHQSHENQPVLVLNSFVAPVSWALGFFKSC